MPRPKRPKLKKPKLPGNQTLFGVLLAFAVIALALANSAVATSPRPSRAVPPLVQSQAQGANPDVIAIVRYPKTIPVEYNSSSTFPITIDLRKLTGPASTFSNITYNLLATGGDGLENLRYEVSPVRAADNPRWAWSLIENHDGRVRKLTHALSVQVIYDLSGGENAGLAKTLEVPFALDVETEDVAFGFYFVAIAIGLLVSYFGSQGGKLRDAVKERKLGKLGGPIAWIAVALLLTPFLYLQFRQAFTTIDVALLNLALATGFGFAFDLGVGKLAATAR